MRERVPEIKRELAVSDRWRKNTPDAIGDGFSCLGLSGFMSVNLVVANDIGLASTALCSPSKACRLTSGDFNDRQTLGP